MVDPNAASTPLAHARPVSSVCSPSVPATRRRLIRLTPAWVTVVVALLSGVAGSFVSVLLRADTSAPQSCAPAFSKRAPPSQVVFRARSALSRTPRNNDLPNRTSSTTKSSMTTTRPTTKTRTKTTSRAITGLPKRCARSRKPRTLSVRQRLLCPRFVCSYPVTPSRSGRQTRHST
jgi:cytoskeletal protein RodZ